MSNDKRGGQLVTDVSAARVTMVVPVWNQLDYTKRLVESINRFVEIPYKLVFVNNGSKDGTKEYLDNLQKQNPTVVEVIHLHTNRGFAHATNLGMQRCEGHMLWLNNDAEFVRPGTLETMVDLLESQPGLGAVGPVSDAVMGPQQVGMNQSYPELHMARFLIGFCMLVKEDVWRKVGKLEEGYNTSSQDDLDYSIRIRKAGYGLAVARRCFVHHAGGVTQMAVWGDDGQFGPRYQQAQAAAREELNKRWGEDTVKELFLPVNLGGARVMVAVPCWQGVQFHAYANHMSRLLAEMKESEKTGMEILLAPMSRSSIVPARNELVRSALKQDCTHLFFLDDDMLLPPRAIHRLVERNMDIVSGLCFLRTPPHFPSAFMDPDEEDGKIYYLKHWPENEPFRVDAVGSACVMIKTDVFRKIADMEVKDDEGNLLKPGKGEDGSDLWYLYGKARPGENTVGEDIFFCKLARRAGYQVWVDPTIVVGHIGEPIIYDDKYFLEMRNKDDARTFPGIPYQSYESARHLAGSGERLLTPEKLAARLGGDPESGEVFARLYAGRVGDGRNPGAKSAAGKSKPISVAGGVLGSNGGDQPGDDNEQGGEREPVSESAA